MNKKLLVGAALAAVLVLTACVKKEAPKDEEQGSTVETTQQETAQPEILAVPEPVETTEIPTHVEVEHQETNNTSATIRREYRDVPAEETQAAAQPATAKAETPKAEAPKAVAAKPAVEKPAPEAQSTSSSSQSEDDAVAAAIAAATPALSN